MTQRRKASVLLQIIVACAAAGLLIWTFEQPGRYLQCLAGAALVILIAAAAAFGHLLSGDRPVNIKDIVLGSYALFLGLGMIAGAFRPAWHFNGIVIVLAYGSLFCLLLGFRLRLGRAPGSPAQILSFGLSNRQLFRVALLFFALGFGFLFLEWALYGHLQSYAGTGTGSHLLSQPKPYIHTFTQLTGPGLLLALVLLRRGAAFVRACLLTCLSGLTIAWYIFSGVRTNLAWLAIAFLLVWSEIPDRRGSRRMRFKAILFTVLTAAAIVAVTVLRTNWDFSRVRSEGISGVWEQVESGLDTFYQFQRTFEYFPARTDFLMGYSLYGIAVNPFPRALWPQKPVGFGRLASMLYDHNPDSTLGLSLPGELYANFGIPGCLIGMFLFGALGAAIWQWYKRHRCDPCALVIYILITEYMWFGIRGDMLDAASPALYQLAPFAVCVLIAAVANSRARQKAFGCAGNFGRGVSRDPGASHILSIGCAGRGMPWRAPTSAQPWFRS